MKALFEESSSVVGYSSEAIIPTSAIAQIDVLHEHLDLEKLKEVAQNVGGEILGEGNHV